MRFKEFLLNEQQAYLAQKVGNILTALQELKDDAKNMGTKDLQAFCYSIAGQMKNILHSSWPREEQKFLKKIQRFAFGIYDCIENKGDLAGMISTVAQGMEQLVAELGVPINKLVPTEPAKDQTKDNKTTSEPETKQPPAQQSAASKPPQPSQNLEAAPQGTPPTGSTGQDMAAPPLGGSTGGLDAF